MMMMMMTSDCNTDYKDRYTRPVRTGPTYGLCEPVLTVSVAHLFIFCSTVHQKQLLTDLSNPFNICNSDSEQQSMIQ